MEENMSGKRQEQKKKTGNRGERFGEGEGGNKKSSRSMNAWN